MSEQTSAVFKSTTTSAHAWLTTTTITSMKRVTREMLRRDNSIHQTASVA